MSEVYEHFKNEMEKLAPHGPYALAISGGPDSMALLHLMCAWEREKEVSFTAITIDHGLREESTAEAEQVGKWCAELGVHHEVLRWRGKDSNGNLEASARAGRYLLLQNWCVHHETFNLLAAHHLDDQVETFLMHLIRGSGVKGLSAMSPVRKMPVAGRTVSLVRPLLGIAKQDLLGLLDDVGQSYFLDPMNEDPALLRTKLRALRETFSDLGLESERLAATAQSMARAQEVLREVEDELWERAVEVSPFGYLTLKTGFYKDALEETRTRVLSRALDAISGGYYGPRFEKLQRLDRAILDDDVNGGVTLRGCEIRAKGDDLVICREFRAAESAKLMGTANRGTWDDRFFLTGGGSCQVRALGVEGLARVRAEIGRGDGLPSARILHSLPAFWEGETLLAVPHLGYGPQAIKAQFTVFD